MTTRTLCDCLPKQASDASSYKQGPHRRPAARTMRPLEPSTLVSTVLRNKTVRVLCPFRIGIVWSCRARLLCGDWSRPARRRGRGGASGKRRQAMRHIAPVDERAYAAAARSCRRPEVLVRWGTVLPPIPRSPGKKRGGGTVPSHMTVPPPGPQTAGAVRHSAGTKLGQKLNPARKELNPPLGKLGDNGRPVRPRRPRAHPPNPHQ
jgi:hypothetical protein